MKELFEYREKLIARLGEAAEEFCEACKAFANPFERVEGDWTVHQIAAYTRDVETFIYGQRIRRTLGEDYPEFTSFDADAWMAEHYDTNEPLEKYLTEFSAGVKEVCELLGNMPQEGWSRLSRHESLSGELTLQLWVERSLAHIEERLLTLKNAENR